MGQFVQNESTRWPIPNELTHFARVRANTRRVYFLRVCFRFVDSARGAWGGRRRFLRRPEIEPSARRPPSPSFARRLRIKFRNASVARAGLSLIVISPARLGATERAVRYTSCFPSQKRPSG